MEDKRPDGSDTCTVAGCGRKFENFTVPPPLSMHPDLHNSLHVPPKSTNVQAVTSTPSYVPMNFVLLPQPALMGQTPGTVVQPIQGIVPQFATMGSMGTMPLIMAPISNNVSSQANNGGVIELSDGEDDEKVSDDKQSEQTADSVNAEKRTRTKIIDETEIVISDDEPDDGEEKRKEPQCGLDMDVQDDGPNFPPESSENEFDVSIKQEPEEERTGENGEMGEMAQSMEPHTHGQAVEPSQPELVSEPLSNPVAVPNMETETPSTEQAMDFSTKEPQVPQMNVDLIEGNPIIKVEPMVEMDTSETVAIPEAQAVGVNPLEESINDPSGNFGGVYPVAMIDASDVGPGLSGDDFTVVAPCQDINGGDRPQEPVEADSADTDGESRTEWINRLLESESLRAIRASRLKDSMGKHRGYPKCAIRIKPLQSARERQRVQAEASRNAFKQQPKKTVPKSKDTQKKKRVTKPVSKNLRSKQVKGKKHEPGRVSSRELKALLADSEERAFTEVKPPPVVVQKKTSTPKRKIEDKPGPRSSKRGKSSRFDSEHEDLGTISDASEISTVSSATMGSVGSKPSTRKGKSPKSSVSPPRTATVTSTRNPKTASSQQTKCAKVKPNIKVPAALLSPKKPYVRLEDVMAKDPMKTAAKPKPKSVSEQLEFFSDDELWQEYAGRKEVYDCACGVTTRDKVMFFLHKSCHNSSDPKGCAFCEFVAPDWNTFMVHMLGHQK